MRCRPGALALRCCSIAAKEENVSEMKESLVMMRDMAKSRIQMLKEGVTFHNDDKKAYYLKEYEARVRELDQQIRRLTLRVVRT
jgi:Na+/phosphate symporter